MQPSPAARTPGISLLIAFFVAATLISGLSALSLALPGGPLEIIWRIKPQARADFARLGVGAVALLGVVCVWMLVAAVGLWQRRRWGWWAAILAFAINGLSDAVAGLATTDHARLIGAPIAALLVWYLMRSTTRRVFDRA